jgi:superfamily II DNA or RNA helicase
VNLEFDDEQPVEGPLDVEAFELAEIELLPAGNGYFELRPYQDEAADDAFEELQDHQSTLIVLPTGTGKTVVFAEMALRWPDHMGRVLVMAHRYELIDQAAEKVGLHLGETPGVEMGSRREQSEYGHGLLDRSKVLITSVQTMSRENRQQRFDPKNFGLLIIDEAHHAPSKSYRRVIEYFLQNPQLRIVGVTATPQRHDEKAMGDIFQTVAYEMTMLDAIEDGWLVDVEQKLVKVDGLDFSKCRTTAGDLNEKDLELQMMGGTLIDRSGELTEEQLVAIQNQERMLHAVVSPTIAEAQGRPTIVFGVTKAHAERLTEIFMRHPGVTAEFVIDTTPPDERKAIIGRFKSGQTQILVGVGVFTEGFDSRADVIVIARPTKSRALYQQMIGRGTRPLPGLVDRYDSAAERREAIGNSVKPCMTVLDFVGAAGQHSLVSACDILGGEYSEDVIQAAKRRMAQSGETIAVEDALAESAQALIEEAAEAARQAEAKRRQFVEDQEKRRLEQAKRLEEEKKRRDAEWARREKIRADAQYRTENVNPFAGQPIPEQVGVGMFHGGASDAQVKFLMRLGVSEVEACKYSKGQAGAVISSIQAKKGGEYIMRIGKYHGAALKTIPKDYLQWAKKNMNDQLLQQNLAEYFQEESPRQA